ncbi:low temperature requirement protein A [Rugosimonospora acidiphila]|uniref:Low temperature requirement protein A n=1 Tax=Rugosimonospora acidiphila TaxID=556531 RepID=A0ABP9SH45_9ACTN
MAAQDDAGQDESTGPRRPEFLELFFDLVYLLALIALASKLINRLSWTSAGETLILLMTFTLIWALTAWAADTFDLNRPTVQGQIIAVSFGSLVMAASVPGVSGSHGLVFVIAYLTIHFGSSLYYIILLRDPAPRTRSVRIFTWFCTTSPLWLTGAILGGWTRWVLWAAAITIEYIGASLGFPTRRLIHPPVLQWRLAGERVSERYRQFLIIAFGVAIFGAASELTDQRFTASRGAALLAAFVTVIMMWRIYIHQAGEKLTSAIATATDRSRYTQFAAVAHVVMVAGVIVTAVNSQLVIRRPSGDTPPTWAAVLLGGPALFLIGRGLLDYTVFSRVSWSRPAGLAVLGAVAAVVHLLPPVLVSTAGTLTLIGVAISNLLAIRATPPRPMAPPIG